MLIVRRNSVLKIVITEELVVRTVSVSVSKGILVPSARRCRVQETIVQGMVSAIVKTENANVRRDGL